MTFVHNGGTPSDKHFNSHAHVERDRLYFAHNLLHIDFNSHAHVERDLCYCERLDRLQHFNSHAHVERDVYPEYGYVFFEFQLTRSRGA